MITIPENQLQLLDRLVKQGVAATRSALLQQIISVFISEVNQMRKNNPPLYEQPQTIEGALEALIAYFLYSLGKVTVDSIFGGTK